jgi:tRNA (guanine37-N1)-methyltransferase
MKKIDVITIFPEMIDDYSKISIIARAIQKKLIKINAVNLRDFTTDMHQTVDGRPYGGGVGMVLRADIMQKAIGKIAGKADSKKRQDARVVMLTPQGKKFTQKEAIKLSKYNNLVFVCGRYEGFDERIGSMVDDEYSIGDYVLMGGELPSLVMIEAIARAYPGVVGKFESTQNESFSGSTKMSLLEYPQYTRPEALNMLSKNGKKKNVVVPKILLSGNHEAIAKWRLDESLKRTKKRRPDLL